MQFILSLKQVIIIFLLMIVGFVCKKVDFIHDITVKDLTNLLLYLVSPCIIINSFLAPFSKKKFQMFVLSMIAAIVVFFVAIIIASIFFGRIKDFPRKAVLKYSTVYSNAGFMGIPLVQAFLGSKGVFFSIPFLVVYNLFMWSHGIRLFSKQDERNIRTKIQSLICNPNIIAAIVGLIIYIVQIKFPSIIDVPLKDLASINTPLSMLIIGSNLSEISLSEVFSNKISWQGTLFRNIIVPIISMFVLKLFQLSQLAYIALIIMISCPIAGVVVLFSILNDFDVKLPTQLLCLSTLMSIFTIPLMIWIASCLT